MSYLPASHSLSFSYRTVFIALCAFAYLIQLFSMDHLREGVSAPHLSHGDRASVNYPNRQEVAAIASHP